MPATILHQVTINGNAIWALRGRHFTTDGVSFSVVSSTITGEGPYNVMHGIKNNSNGKHADIEMTKLIAILLQSE